MTTTLSERAAARVVVGMPVFNGEATLANAIESILGQTFADFKLIISDNASTDATTDICTRFAATDSRIEYIRQETNVGAEANFDLVLKLANSEYFMWAADDDLRSSDFLSLCVSFLDRHPDYIAATCPTRYTGGAPDPVAMGDYSLDDDDTNNNIVNLFDKSGRLRVNSRFYSLFRYHALSSWLLQPKDYLGSDWSLVVQLLRIGKFKRMDSGYTELGRNGISKQLSVFALYRHNLINWVVPFLELSRVAKGALNNPTYQQRIDLLWRLANLNARIFRRQVVYEVKRRCNALLV